MTTQQPQENQQLPAAGNVAIYIRSATQEKKTKERTIQQHDLIQLAHTLGFDDSRIFLFEGDNGTSGNTDIDKRVGLASIMREIAQGSIQAILVADETRLFRDVSYAQLHTFIQVCSEHNAIVYTPVATYDFSNPLHVKLFRFHCEQAFVVLKEAYKITRWTRSNHNGS